MSSLVNNSIPSLDTLCHSSNNSDLNQNQIAFVSDDGSPTATNGAGSDTIVNQLLEKTVHSAATINKYLDDDDDIDQQLNDSSDDSGIMGESIDISIVFPEFDIFAKGCESLEDHSLVTMQFDSPTSSSKYLEKQSCPTKIMHLTDSLSSVINSPVSSSSDVATSSSNTLLTLPTNAHRQKVMPPNSSTSIGGVENGAMNYQITSNTIQYCDEQSLKFDNHHGFGATSLDQWNPQSNTVISFRTKSSSSSSSTSSGCSSDFDLGANSPEEDHSHLHHDTSPDSPDSGLSGSVNSADDLKHMDDEDDPDLNCKDDCSTDEIVSAFKASSSFQVMDLDDIYAAKFNTAEQIIQRPTEEENKVCSKASVDLFSTTEQTNSMNDTRSIISQLRITAKNNGTKNKSKKQPKYFCQWLNCDWPGNYEDLADHVREIHVELQPYLDSNGKVIKWSAQAKLNSRSDRNHNDDFKFEDDDTFCNSASDDDTEEEEDETPESDDDCQSSASSSCRVTRRTRRTNELLDYSRSNNTLRRSSRQTDQRSNGDLSKPSQQQFVCLWHGCKVFGKPSSSRQWIERHVLEQHSGPKPFKCIVESCGQRFKTQISLERHVNTHFKTNNNLVVNGLANSSGTANISGVADDSSNNSNANNRRPPNCCCKCSCHSCMLCDNNSPTNAHCCPSSSPDDPNIASDANKLTLRSEKWNRCSSTDSAISIGSTSSSDSCPSSSTLSSQSLSKPLSYSSQNENCHTLCCCSNKSTSDLCFITKTKLSRNNKKRLLLAKRPIVKSISNFDYLDPRYAEILAYKHRTRELFLSNLPANQTVLKPILYKDDKTVQSIPSNLENDDKKLSDFSAENDTSDYSTSSDGYTNQTKGNASCKTAQIFDKRLFNVMPNQFKFISEVIGCRKHVNGNVEFHLRWHPPGILDNTFVSEDELEHNRTRLVPYQQLPESFRHCLLDFHCAKRKVYNPDSIKSNGSQQGETVKTVQINANGCDENGEVATEPDKKRRKLYN